MSMNEEEETGQNEWEQTDNVRREQDKRMTDNVRKE